MVSSLDWRIFSGWGLPLEYTESEYSLHTLPKLTIGSAFFFGKLGFLSADIDFIDYSKVKLSSHDFETDLNLDNQSIRGLYKNAVNFRIGREVRVVAFRFRGGYSYEEPYIGSGINNSIKKISGGVGYRNKKYFIDLFVICAKYNIARSPYVIDSLGDSLIYLHPVAYTNNKNKNIAITVGINY